jgi:hypothetical protein
MKRRIMRGLQLQKAMTLVAEGKLSESEIAALLKVRLSALEQTMEQPYFSRRVNEMRSGSGFGDFAVTDRVSQKDSKAAVANR